MFVCRQGSDLLGFTELCPESDAGRREASQHVCGLELGLRSSRAPFRVCGRDVLGVICRHPLWNTQLCVRRKAQAVVWFLSPMGWSGAICGGFALFEEGAQRARTWMTKPLTTPRLLPSDLCRFNAC